MTSHDMHDKTRTRPDRNRIRALPPHIILFYCRGRVAVACFGVLDSFLFWSSREGSGSHDACRDSRTASVFYIQQNKKQNEKTNKHQYVGGCLTMTELTIVACRDGAFLFFSF